MFKLCNQLICVLLLAFYVGSNTLSAQGNFQVTGRVTDVADVPLVGVSITVKGKPIGTSTDTLGVYQIQASANDVLIFSIVGKNNQEIAINNRRSIDVKMQDNTTGLDEVVVIGYGSVARKDISGAVSSANLKAFKESPNVNILQSMQGSVPGLNIGMPTQAGQSPQVSVRGRVSISGTSSPLIVLDGIIYRGNLSDISPADIASVEILKDASAAAIYGSQASNGVMLISTKTGTGGGQPSISFNSSWSFQSVANRDMLPMDTAGFARVRRDVWIAQSRTGDDLLSPNPSWDILNVMSGEIGEGIRNGVSTDWWSLLTDPNPMIQDYSLGISGRNEQSSYYLGFGYTDQQNVIINDQFQRYNIRANVESKIRKWFKLGLQSNFSTNDFSGVSPMIGDVVQFSPFLPAFDQNGNLVERPNGSAVNPLLDVQRNDLDIRNNLFGLLYADIQIPFVKGLNYRINFGHNYIQEKKFIDDPYANNFVGLASKFNSSRYNQTLDHILSYQRQFGDHNINGTFVYGYEINNYESTLASASALGNDVLGFNNLGAGTVLQAPVSEAWRETSLYQLYRLIYTYKDRYIFTGSLRNDGFSGFSEANKIARFPSAAVAWRISEESFLKGVDNIDELKLRVSYGRSGNRTVGRYQTLSQMNVLYGNGYLFGDGGTAELGQRLATLPNSDLRWETTTRFNFGVDFSFFQGRLSGDFNMYQDDTRDLLYAVNIPASNGLVPVGNVQSMPMNIGQLANRGLELTLNGTPITKGDFSWNSTVAFSLNRNRVVSILGIDANNDGVEDDLTASKIFIDHPYGVAYDFNIIGMWQVEDFRNGDIPAGFTYGTYRVEDINGDGVYSMAADRKILGYTDPSYRISWLNTFRYKQFELKVFLNSIQGGRDFYYGQPGQTLRNPDNTRFNNIFNFDYWTPENPDARYRQLGAYTTTLTEQFSPYIQRNFIRLQDLTLSYDIPEELSKKLFTKRARIFLNGKNLFTWTDWDGWDPEITDEAVAVNPDGVAIGMAGGLNPNGLPVMKSYSIGLSFDF